MQIFNEQDQALADLILLALAKVKTSFFFSSLKLCGCAAGFFKLLKVNRKKGREG
jgi:hypothetical protein